MARVLLKLRPSSALVALERRGRLRPLFQARAPFAATPQEDWFVAEQDGPHEVAWDLAHARVSDELGLSPDDVLFVDSIPLTATGKMDKKVVRAQLEADGYKLPDQH